METILAVWRMQEFKNVLGVFVWLGAINTAFWLLARAAGAFVFLFDEILWDWLWSLLATVYNIVLAALFSAVIFLAATRGAEPDALLWRQMCGFVLLYLALSAAYMDLKTNEIDDYSRPGFIVGLAAYILFAAFPRLVDHPELVDLHDLIKAVAKSWVGVVFSAYMTAVVVWRIVHQGLGELFYHLSPFLWFAGLLKHPPIRVRRRREN